MINSLRHGAEAQGPERRIIPRKPPEEIKAPEICSQETIQFKKRDWEYAPTEKGKGAWIISPNRSKYKRRTCTTSLTSYNKDLIDQYHNGNT